MPKNTNYRSCMDFESQDELVQALGALNVSSSDNENGAQADWRIDVGEHETLPQDVQREARRLQVLKSYQILDTEKDDSFDRLTDEVHRKYNVPWACISLIDIGRQWFKSMTKDDLNITETSRHDAFCSHTILQKEPLMVVPDAQQDERFQNNPLVTGKPGFRFYAAAPLSSLEGERLGTLCILDNEPRPQGLDVAEEDYLLSRAKEVMSLLEERRQNHSDRVKRSAHLPSLASDVSVDTQQSAASSKKSRRSADSPSVPTPVPEVIPKPQLDVLLPDPNTIGLHPDDYLQKLVSAVCGIKLKQKDALELDDYFTPVTDKQISRYTVDLVEAVRENQLRKVHDICVRKGPEALDCFNRFGEGLLNLSCRRGFVKMTAFLLSDQVDLNVRVRDDYGRTPLHDACWNPKPQLEICAMLLRKDPSLFLVADKRGYTPFQYARSSDWHVWRHFLIEHRDLLRGLLRPEVTARFGA